MKKKRKIMNVKVSDEGNNTLKFRVTDETHDRDNEILTLDGWDIRNFRKNPVVLWSHNPFDLPIAKAKTIKISEDEGMVAKAQFPERDVHPFANTIYRLYKGGYLNTVSIGYIENERMQGENGNPSKITKKEMLEFSGVTIPANPNATQLSAIKSAVDDGVINEQEAQECALQSKKFNEEYFKAHKEDDATEENEDDKYKDLPLDVEVKLGNDGDEEEPEAPEEKPVEDDAQEAGEGAEEAKQDEAPEEKDTDDSEADGGSEEPAESDVEEKKSIYDEFLSINLSKQPEKEKQLDKKLVDDFNKTNFKKDGE